jgi:hypothetical protein
VKRKTSLRALGLVPLLVPALLLLGSHAVAQAAGSCTQQEYRLLTPTALAIRCVDDVSVLGIQGGAGTVIFHGDSNYAQSIGNVKISRFTSGNFWLLLTLSGSNGRLEAGKKYTLTLTYSMLSGSAPKPESIDIDTTETVSVSASLINRHSAQSFHLKSAVGFSSTGNALSFLARNGNVLEPPHSCIISVLNGVNHLLSEPARCSTLKSLSASPTEQELQSVDPDDVGVYDVTFDEAPATPLIPGPLPFKTIFGNTPKVDSKSRFSPKKAPATKDASQYYINMNWAAGVGTVPAWVLDGQIGPKLWMPGGFAVGPLASADVGNNKLAGQTYTDTVDFGFTAQKPHFFRDGPHPVLGELLFVTGAKYETDEEFDRDNVLGTADLQYNFTGLYHTHEVGALQRYNRAMRQYLEQKSAGSTPPYQPQIDDFQPPVVGYALDFHTGVEAGGSVVDTTVHASTGKATQVLPAYSIFRFVPQVHGLLELSKLSFDANMTGRGLTLTENTVLETAAHSLILRQIQGWKGILTLTNTYTFDSQGHFALNLVFKDGFAPPTYKRVNAVQGGLLLKY